MDLVSEMIVDGVLAVLLVTAIVVSIIVYKRLGTIREGQAQLRELVDDLNRAVMNAQSSVAGLKKSAVEIEEILQARVQKASALADELGMITEAGNNLADRIERGLTTANRGDTVQPKAEKASSKQQQEILAALREAR
jgi:predicted PurR-regulated permease PerM